MRNHALPGAQAVGYYAYESHHVLRAVVLQDQVVVLHDFQMPHGRLAFLLALLTPLFYDMCMPKTSRQRGKTTKSRMGRPREITNPFSVNVCMEWEDFKKLRERHPGLSNARTVRESLRDYLGDDATKGIR